MQENEFAWDCNRIWICHEPQNEIGEDLLVRERAPGCEPEDLNKAQQGDAVKP
jgi:hypothetical protein